MGNKDFKNKYLPIWKIIDNRWNNQLLWPIHVDGYFLNPRYHYKAIVGQDELGEVKDGLYTCLEHKVPNQKVQLEIHKRINVLVESKVPLVEN
jgi:hypothetical protein